MKKIILSLVTVLAAISCSSLMEKDALLNERQIAFTTNIGEYATKATASGFEAGDEIGVIALEPISALNVKYTISGSSLTSDTPICWLEDQTDYTEFMAYYPYDPDFNFFEQYAYNIKVEKDQRTHAAYSRSDFMVAENRVKPDETVALQFRHRLSRVDIAIGGSLAGKVSSVALDDVYSVINVAEGPVGEKGAILAAKAQNADGEDVWSLILVPQETAPTLVVTTTDGEQLTYPLGQSIWFESNCRYKATLSLKADGSLDAEFAFQVYDWVYGDWMFFDTYKPRWSIVGNFTSWDWDYDMTQVSDGVYEVTLDLPEEAEFKFRKDYKWDEQFGATEENVDDNFRSLIEAGKVIPLLPGGPNLYFPQGGYVTITLDVNNSTALVSEAHRNMTLFGANFDFWKEMEWKDGAYALEDVYVQDGGILALQDWNWNQYGLESGEQSVDGYDVASISPESPVSLVMGGSVLMYVENGGWMDFTWSPEEGLFTMNRSENQGFTIRRIYSSVADDTAVSLENVTVYSLSEEGFVVSEDGHLGLYVYSGYGNSLPAVGDVVKIQGVKTTFAELPEIIGATFEKTGEAALEEVVYSELQGGRYSVSVPVTFEGQLYARPLTNHEVVFIDSPWGMFRTHYCFDEYLKYYGSRVKVRGWYGGNTDNFGYITVDAIEGLQELDHGKGTLDSPFDPVGAVLYAKTLEPGSASAEDVFIHGYVSEVLKQYSADTGTASFRITLGGESSYECYFEMDDAAFLENKPWEEGNSEIYRWDRVLVCGKLYLDSNGGTRTAPSQAYLYSLNGMTSEVPAPYQYVGDGSLENPFTVQDAIHKAKAVGENASEDSYYIKGRVTNVRNCFGSAYGNATFGMWDGNDREQILQANQILYFGGERWQEGQLDISDDDEVIIYSPLVYYGGSTAEAIQGYIYSINGTTSSEGASDDFGCDWVLSGNMGTEIPLCFVGSRQEDSFASEMLYAIVHYKAGEKFQVLNKTTGDKWSTDYGISGIGSRTLIRDGNPFLLPYVGYFEAQLNITSDYKHLEIHPFGEESPWLVNYEWAFDSVLSTDNGPVLKLSGKELSEQEAIRLTFHWSYSLGPEQEVVTMQPGQTYPLVVASENAFLVPEAGTYDLLLNPADLTLGIIRSDL